MRENDSKEKKISKEKKALLMTNLRDIMIKEGASVAFAKRIDAFCFFWFMLEYISVPALKTCSKMLRERERERDRERESGELAKTLLLQEPLDIHRSQPMWANIKEPVELEPSKKMEDIRIFSYQELRLAKESIGTVLKSTGYCEPIKRSHTILFREVLEGQTILSSARTYVIVTSIANKR